MTDAEKRAFAAGIEAAVDRLRKLSGKLDILACEDVLQIADELSTLTPSVPATAPVVPKVKPLVFDWIHQPTENPSEHVTIGDGYSARVYIPYEHGNDPASSVGTWCGVAQQCSQSEFPSKEAAVAYCERVIREFAQISINRASNFLDMAPVSVQEAARVLLDSTGALKELAKAICFYEGDPFRIARAGLHYTIDPTGETVPEEYKSHKLFTVEGGVFLDAYTKFEIEDALRSNSSPRERRNALAALRALAEQEDGQ